VNSFALVLSFLVTQDAAAQEPPEPALAPCAWVYEAKEEPTLAQIKACLKALVERDRGRVLPAER
jgi:hypothetical protein